MSSFIIAPAPKEEIFTLRELAAYLKVNPRTVYRLLAARQLPAFRVGHAWRFRKADVEAWAHAGGASLTEADEPRDG